MRANLFWFSDGQWARIEPFIPSNRRGVKPKNNRLILSGIMQRMSMGRLSAGIWAGQDGLQSLQPLE
jgi:transposase